MATPGQRRHQVVILGGGFGGLHAARQLRRAPVDVTLIDRNNYHLFQPLLYQVATGGLSPANISAPLRSILKKQKNTRVLMGEVVDIDVAARQVRLSDAQTIDYDTLIVATGARHNYFGHPEWEEHAPGLKTIEDATSIRARVLKAFEDAEREEDPDKIRGLLTFVVVGGGPTGVELAGALAEIARHTLPGEFRAINPAQARIILLEAADRILLAYPPELAQKAVAGLERLGVAVRTGSMVTAVEPDAVTVRVGEQTETIPAHTVLWAAGIQASRLGKVLAEATGAKLDRAGRIAVEADCSLPGHPEIFVIGDLALYTHQDGKPLPGVAPVAIQQGRYVARLIEARLRGKEVQPFRYRDYGNMATIGRSAAIVDFGKIHLSGFIAWLVWLFVHLMNLVEFQNRVLVLLQWAWNYLTRNRAARLITGR